MVKDKQPGVKEIPVSWVGTEEVLIQFVNNVIVQLDDRADAILTLVRRHLRP